MKETAQVTFDVPIDELAFVQAACVEAHISFRDFMKDVFHRTAEELKKKRLHDMLKQGFQEVKEGKTTPLTKKNLGRWNEVVDNA